MKISFKATMPARTNVHIYLRALTTKKTGPGVARSLPDFIRPIATMKRPDNGQRKDDLGWFRIATEEKRQRIYLGDFQGVKDTGAWTARGGRLMAKIMQENIDEVVIHTMLPAEALLECAEGMSLMAYRFDKFRTVDNPHDHPAHIPQHLTFVGPNAAAAQRSWASRATLVEGVYLARDWINEPGNILYPESFAGALRRLTALGIEVDILDAAALRRLGAGALLAVGEGSAHRPCLAVMRWRGPGVAKTAKPVALVGKGVTYDTGGISLKPQAYQLNMKGDMGGAAVCAATLAVLARNRVKTHAVAVLPLVENMPSGQAFRPGDVVHSLSGKTIEIIDTDAEGRLILADALYYAASQLNPSHIIDLATLTGSIIAALGRSYAGLFSNNDRLAERLLQAGAATGEKLWRMPIAETYAANLRSDIADLRQVAADEERADACHATAFLQQFIGRTPWAHLDIAGKEIAARPHDLGPAGGTGFGVRLLSRFFGI